MASRAITRHCAGDVVAQCVEDLSELSGRLCHIAAAVSGAALAAESRLW